MLSKMGTIGDKPVDSDSVNLGSNPSSPATTKAHEIGTSGDFGHVERAAKSEQNAYTGCTEPGTVDIIGARKFGRWLDTARDGMAPPVQEAADRALQSLLTKEQAAYAFSVAMQTEALKDLLAFADAATAYAEHRRGA